MPAPMAPGKVSRHARTALRSWAEEASHRTRMRSLARHCSPIDRMTMGRQQRTRSDVSRPSPRMPQVLSLHVVPVIAWRREGVARPLICEWCMGRVALTPVWPRKGVVMSMWNKSGAFTVTLALALLGSPAPAHAGFISRLVGPEPVAGANDVRNRVAVAESESRSSDVADEPVAELDAWKPLHAFVGNW